MTSTLKLVDDLTPEEKDDLLHQIVQIPDLSPEDLRFSDDVNHTVPNG